MKKIPSVILLGIFLATFAYCRDGTIWKTNEQIQVQSERRIPEPSEVAGKAKEFLEIQKKLFDMERETIQQDQELKQMAEQIKQLQQQLREKVEDKLKTNEEYQSLKQRREQIRQEYIKANLKPKESPVKRLDRR